MITAWWSRSNASRRRVLRYITVLLGFTAVVYAFCAGFRTIGDFDFGWQIATGRYVAQHHQIPTSDVLSYSSAGAAWSYAVLPGLIFYWLFLLGGYAILSWLLAVAAVMTVGILLRRAGPATAMAAFLAVPSIVFRENARAELFTTLLFAAYVSLLWNYFRSGRLRFWLLPLLMLLWVNLHPGFVTGLAMIAGYLVLELCELPFGDRRQVAHQRLKRIAPWLLGVLAASLINPSGPMIYRALWYQNRSVKELGDFIGEWSKPNLSVAVFRQLLHWRNPESSFWWLLLFTLAALIMAVWRKNLGPAILLAGAGILSLQYLRFQGLFACVAVVIGGAVVDDFISERKSERTDSVPSTSRFRSGWVAVPVLLGAAIIVITAVRCSDLITNRHYLEAGEVVLFGPGEADWFPERAAKFLTDHRLSGNLFNDYNLGGFLDWRLPDYKTYADSRAIPFGAVVLRHQQSLVAHPLDSPEWMEEASRWNINLVIFSLDRFTGLGAAPLQVDCTSTNWSPVYMDETAAIFARKLPQTADLVRNIAVDCSSVQIPEPSEIHGDSFRARGIAYNFSANAGSLFYLLGRDKEAEQYLARAEQIESHDPNLHLTRAQLLEADGNITDAEREYKASIDQRPTDIACYLLGILYVRQQRYREAAEFIKQSAEISYEPAQRWRTVGQIENAMQEPKQALQAFDRASSIGSHGDSEQQNLLKAQIASGRAQSWLLLHDLDRAIDEARRSAQLLPNDPNRWRTLAQLYQQKGDVSKADQAQAKADGLQSAPVH
ncbi:MAG TPA: hypothetical protein VM912_14340 [Terriglobales bacterium]|nr:hypothetical protein [Terriglobales bacterium]